jgi:alkanesulfonate monooxygenase SsuD/methylene tetrahydromethanopterin reductase-like flavin-dependent oxidoreductase (luciferase family)
LASDSTVPGRQTDPADAWAEKRIGGAAGLTARVPEEAIGIIRQLWTGATLDHHGRHYIVENARLWTLPDFPPPILLSAFGPKSVALAARACEGYIGAWPAKRLIGRYRERIPGGPDPERHLAAIQAYADAGYDEVHIL